MENQGKAPGKDGSKEGGSSERSTIEFPYTDLDNAVEIVRGVHEVGGTACDSDQLAAHLGLEAKGGGFRLRLIGAKMYGLISYERGGRNTLTELGRQMTDSQLERAARAESFLRVPLFKQVYEEFKGRPLPPQAALERTIIGLGVGAKVADKARQVLMRSAKQAGYFDLKPDRLTAPPIRENAIAVEQPLQREETTKPLSVGGSEAYHPLIQGLLVTLPKAQANWSTADRMNWLTMANSILKTLYPPQDNVEIEIALRESKL